MGSLGLCSLHKSFKTKRVQRFNVIKSKVLRLVGCAALYTAHRGSADPGDRNHLLSTPELLSELAELPYIPTVEVYKIAIF